MKLDLELDPDGYPNTFSLQKIEDFKDFRQFGELMEAIKNIWWCPDFGWSGPLTTPPAETAQCDKEDGGQWYRLATGGWSGNESIISALEQNRFFWSTCWYASFRGGLYIFNVKNYD